MELLNAAWFYLHDNDECQLRSQNMPELHRVGVLPVMARRVAVITIPTKKECVKICVKYIKSLIYVGILELKMAEGHQSLDHLKAATDS